MTFEMPKTFIEGISSLHKKSEGAEKEFFALLDGHLRALYFKTDQHHFDQQLPALRPANLAIYDWLDAHTKIEDLKTHPEWKALKKLLGVQE